MLPHLVWIADHDGVVEHFSGQVELYAADLERLAGGFDWSALVHADDVDRTQRAWAAAVARRTRFECEHRVRMADGSHRRHLSRALLIDSDQGVMWVGTATDTQLVVDLQATATDSDQRLQLVFSHLDQGYCVCEMVFDRTGRPVDYRFLETNDRFETATGLKDAAGRTALELVPTLESQWIETYAEVAFGNSPLRFQQRSDAMGRFFDVFATPIPPRGRFALVFADITERHEALAALSESEARFRNLADHAPVMIWVTDASGWCTYLNRRWYEFTGQNEADALGFGWLLATHPDDRAAAEAEFRDATLNRRSFSLDYRLRRADGVYRWAVDAADPRFGDDGSFYGFIGSVLDITERKEAEQAIAAQRDREHAIAVRLQSAMLPTGLIEDGRIELAAEYLPNTKLLQVGGDWYETFRLRDGRIGFVVGDVVGSNIDAAVAMGQLRAGLLALAGGAAAPDALLADLHDYAVSCTITDFATAVCIFIDPADGALEYSSAGHPPALVSSSDGSHRWLDRATSPPLGLSMPITRSAATAELAHDDTLVAYSDGLIERRHRCLDTAMEQLAAAVSAQRDRPTDALCRHVLETMSGPTGLEDDTVVVVLRRSNGRPQRHAGGVSADPRVQ